MRRIENNRRRSITSAAAICTLVSLLASLPHAASAARADREQAALDRDLQPSPQLTPEDVIRWQIRALSAAGDINERIKRCYRFASPANRIYTGPLDRFANMVKAAPYDALLNARHILVGRANIDRNQAHILLTVVNDRNELNLFRCFLSKQSSADVRDCWMTDAVIQVGSAAPPALPEKPSSPAI